MGISTLLKDPTLLYENMAAYASSRERVEQGFAHLSYSNGLMTAVIIGPELISPDEWLPEVVDLSGAQGEIEDMQLLTNLILLEYHKILESLTADEKTYEPFFWEDGNERIVTKDWAEGFVHGIRLRPDAWAPVLQGDDRVFGTLLYVLLQKDGLYEELTERGLNPEEIFDAAQKETSNIVQSLHDFWAEQRSETPYMATRRIQKTGRNDPCPCGSGKKYKKCCLN